MGMAHMHTVLEKKGEQPDANRNSAYERVALLIRQSRIVIPDRDRMR